MSVAVGRYIGETSVNGIEWILDENNEVKRFSNRKAAKDFLRGHGFVGDDEAMEDSFFFDHNDEFWGEGVN